MTLAPAGGFRLRGGAVLPSVRIAFTFYGRDPQAAPPILVCHALTGNSRVHEWWSGLIGPGKALDTDRHAVVGANAIGSCYGSTGPASADPSGSPWGERFPVVTVEDMVRAQREALAMLGVARLRAVIGGSLGGQQALQWGAAYPDAVERVVAIGATARLSPLGIGLNAIGREAIRIGGDRGLHVARMLGMLSYKSADLLWRRHSRRADRSGRRPDESLDAKFDVEGYLHHQGRKIVARMDGRSYAYLTKAMDLFELEPAGWRVPALLVGIESDWLYPPAEVEATARALGPAARFELLRSDYGHDAFLVEPGRIATIVAPFLEAGRPVRPVPSW